MSTDKILLVESTSSDDTERIAEKLAHNLKGGEVIELVSDLGGGKTTFVRGLARGIGSEDRVSSPTFTISKVYQSQSRNIHHFDFYRLADAGLVGLELHDLLGEPDVIVVVEWADTVQHVLPQDRLRVNITRTGDTTRVIQFTAHGSIQYALEGLL